MAILIRPAIYWTRAYFTNSAGLKKYRGRSNATLMTTLQNDLKLIDMKLETEEDLNMLQTLACSTEPELNWYPLTRAMSNRIDQTI